jgi:hypothetical protein
MTISVPTRQCGHRGRAPSDDVRAGSGACDAAITVSAADPHQPEHLPHLVAAEDRGQPRRRRGPHEPERRPRLVQRLLVQEADRAQRDRGGRPRDVLLVRQVQEVLAQLLFGEVRRAGVEMLGELADGGDVASLGPCGGTGTAPRRRSSRRSSRRRWENPTVSSKGLIYPPQADLVQHPLAADSGGCHHDAAAAEAETLETT